MNFLVKLFPFIPEKGDTTKLIVGLIFYILLVPVGVPIATVALAITIILAALIPVVIPLLCVYSAAGFIFTILNFAGVMDFAKYKA